MYVSSILGVVILLLFLGIVLIVVNSLASGEVTAPTSIPCTTAPDCPTGYYCSSFKQCIANGRCQGNNDCFVGQYCVDSYCVECTRNEQCPAGSTCIDGRCSLMICDRQNCPNGFYCDIIPSSDVFLCQPQTCLINTDCPGTKICVSGNCITPGTACQRSVECYHGALQCINGLCLQCQTDSDCPGYCVDGVCVSGCDPGCPSGTLCAGVNCCPGTSPCGNFCQTSRECSGDCPFCAEGVCTCKGKDVGSPCSENGECQSIICRNGICQGKRAECIMGNNDCPPDKSYCIEGYCSSSPIGQFCGNCPPDLYCVNNKCQSNPGGLGAGCNDTSDCVMGLGCSGGVCLL